MTDTVLNDINKIISNPVEYFTENVLSDLIDIFLKIEINFTDKFKTFFKSFLQSEFKTLSFNKLQRVKILLFIFQTLINLVSVPIYILRLILSLFLIGNLLDVILILILYASYIISIIPLGFIIYKSLMTLMNIYIDLFFKIII